MIRGDSTEYDLLKKWCETLPFFEEPKSVTTCEIGVREGLGSQVIMLSIKNRIGNKPYEHIGIDPYGDLEYPHFDDEVKDPHWKNEKGEWTSKPPTYPNSMRDQMVKDFATNKNFRFYNCLNKRIPSLFNSYKRMYFSEINRKINELEKQLLETLNGKMIDITLSEGVDTRLRRLATQGLIAKDELALFTKLMKDLDDGKTPTLPQRMMVMRIFDKLLKLIMDNKEVYQRVLQTVKKGKKVKKEAFEATHTIVEHKGRRFYVGENNELVPYEGE